MKPLLFIPLIILITTGATCQRRPNVPEQVKVIIKEQRPTPTWATEQLVKPQAQNGTVAAHLTSEDQRGNVIDRANCHRRLLSMLDKGEPVDPKDCDR